MKYTVIKRDGEKESFEENKIKIAILKAYLSATKNKPTLDELDIIINEVKMLIDKIVDNSGFVKVEDIQDCVEKSLMELKYFSIAKKFILYREKHNEHRETLDKFNFMKTYVRSNNAASGSKYDSNANVENKNIATLMGELPKGEFINLNRKILTSAIKKRYSKELSNEYLELLNSHILYKNDETSLANYCASITMYPWLLDGTKAIGGNSTAPTNLKAFCGGFINMVFMVSGMLSGAVATPEFLMYMDYFIRKEYGENYTHNLDEVVDLSTKKRTLEKVLFDYFEQIVYSLNQPTGARNYQAVFWNISYYDKYYFNSLFENFVFPDNSKPSWKTTSILQKLFMKWFNNERLKTPITFPVETIALLTDGEKPKDKEYGDFTAEMYSKGHSFFTYLSDTPDSLSSCCRLRNEITTNEFSFTLGAGGVSTGSKSVLTINLNRCIQEYYKDNLGSVIMNNGKKKDLMNIVFKGFEDIVDIMHKVQIAYNDNLIELKNNGLLPLFDAGYINIKRQYLTIGINGLVEAAEFLGIEISDNKEYSDFVQTILGIIEKKNKEYRTKDLMFNCEMIPR